MKKIALILCLIMTASLFIISPSAATFKEGEIIYCQNFDGISNTDDTAIIESTLGYKVVKFDTSTLTDIPVSEKNISETIKYSIKDGKLCIDNSDDGGAYSYLYVFDSPIMESLVKETYTIQYEITYLAGPTSYSSPIMNWDGKFTYQVPMFRGNGTYRNQVRWDNKEKMKNEWLDWDGMSGTWLPTDVYENDTALIENVVVRMVSVPDKGIYIYANNFLVSEPSDIRTAKDDCLPGKLPYSAVGIRTQKGAYVVIDNFAIYAGDGSKFTPDFSAYGFKGLPPVDPTTTETEATKAPETHSDIVSTAKPDETKVPETKATETKATEPTAAPAKTGCGSYVSATVAAVAIIGTAVVFKKKK